LLLLLHQLQVVTLVRLKQKIASLLSLLLLATRKSTSSKKYALKLYGREI